MDVTTSMHLLNAFAESCLTYYTAPPDTAIALGALKAMHIYKDLLAAALYAYTPPIAPEKVS